MPDFENHRAPRPAIYCVIPAAGIGKRMQAERPKQYLSINDKTILQHTVNRMQAMAFIEQVIVVIHPEDQYFQQLTFEGAVTAVIGGAERVDSVLAGLNAIDDSSDAWVLVHDAARPNVAQQDVEKLVSQCLAANCGGILAAPVRDTMKRGARFIESTEPREQLWHALTPQFFALAPLKKALEQGIAAAANITDEASAMENAGEKVLLVEGRADNLKITRPEDLALASFYLAQ